MTVAYTPNSILKLNSQNINIKNDDLLWESESSNLYRYILFGDLIDGRVTTEGGNEVENQLTNTETILNSNDIDTSKEGE